MYDYKDGIALRTIGPDTPWESIYHALYSRLPKEELLFYLVQQINLYREFKLYECTECSVNANFKQALTKYAEDNKISFDIACTRFYELGLFSADEKFREVFEEIISTYGFSENALADMIGYNRSVFNKIRSDKRTVPKKVLYSLALFLEYDIDECEEFFNNSPHPLHHCYPDNIFRAYVQSGNKSIQPFVDICVNKLRKENLDRSLSKKKQLELDSGFFKPECVYSYLVISDFKTADGYDFSSKRIKELKEKTAKVRKTYDDRLIKIAW